MLRVVADTNVLVSAIIAKGNEYLLLKEAKLGRIRLVLSLQIINELKGVLSRPKFGFSNEQVESVVKHIISISEIIVATSIVYVVKEDPSDNKIIEATIDGEADYIVSGDRDLLRLQKFKNIKIVSSATLLRVISR